MLGSDPARPQRDSPTPAYGNGSPPSGSFQPLSHYQSTTSSPIRQGAIVSSEHPSPSQHNLPTPSIGNRPSRAYSGDHMGMQSSSPSSATAMRYGAAPVDGSLHPQMSPRSAARERLPEYPKSSISGRLIDRPNSQPPPYNPAPLDFDKRVREIEIRRTEIARQEMEIGRHGFGVRGKSSTLDPFNRTLSSEKMEDSMRPRSLIDHKFHQDGRSTRSAYSSTTKPQSAETSRPGANTLHNRELASHSPAQRRSLGSEISRRLTDERLNSIPGQSVQDLSESSGALRSRTLEQLEGRPSPSESRQLLAAQTMDRSRSNDSAILHRHSDDLSFHRHSLAAILDSNRRGRLSPLPQAVLGAQSRMNGPSRDPSIKSEFSKVFAGIGGGVSSSGLAGSGASTPIPPSPKQSVENDQRLPGKANKGQGSDSRSASRVGKKRMKLKEEEQANDRENGDPKSAIGPVASRGAKRSKHSHHHHTHGHQ